MRLASAKEGDRVRALGGIDRDPDWQGLPEHDRPIPNEFYTVQSVGICMCCGGDTFTLAELPVTILHHDGNVRIRRSAKAEWFTCEGTRAQ